MIWQKYIEHGNTFKHAAIWAASSEEERDAWQKAAEAYHQALTTIDIPESLQAVQLHRELATCFRKLGNSTKARSEYLNKSFQLLNRLLGRVIDYRSLQLEQMLCKLESTYLKFSEEEWKIVKHDAEEMIEQCEWNSNQEQAIDYSYIVGCSYNILAIAIQHLGVEANSSTKTPDQCWKIAADNLSRANDERSIIVLGQIKRNRATRWFEEGHCDLAIDELQGFLENQEATLPTRARLAIQQTLISAYIERLEPDDIAKADHLAQKVLGWARQHDNINEWFYALHSFLRVIKEKINQAEDRDSKALIDLAQEEYNQLQQHLTLQNVHMIDLQDDDIELHRLLIECYLAARLTDDANDHMIYLMQHPLQETLRDNGDILLTSAYYASQRLDLSTAISDVNRARSHFDKAGHQGRVIDADLLWAKLDVYQDNWVAAEERLSKALEKARKLICKAREKRVADLRERVRRRDPILLQRIPLLGIKVLMLAASPQDNVRLNWEKESKAIQRVFLDVKVPNHHKVEPVGAVRAKELEYWLLKIRPNIVHFAGHGTQTGELVFQADDGSSEIVSVEVLVELFRLCKEKIRCVMLNACFTESLAIVLSQHIDYVIGMTADVTDQAAIEFAEAFYFNLASGKDITDAFMLARNKLQRIYPAQTGLPRLFSSTYQA